MSKAVNSERPFALLDADFIIKATIAQKDEKNHLLDWILSNLQYQFVCHEMAMEEISKHDNLGVVFWFNKAIKSGNVRIFTDLDIINKLYDFMGPAGIDMYKSFLKTSCDSMSSTFYKEFYSLIENSSLTDEIGSFVDILKQCDVAIGSGKSLGERKAMVLLQYLQFFYPDKVYLFCSDDRKARAGLYSITSVPCKSLMSVFWDMKMQGIDKTESYKYFYPYEQFMTQHGKTTGNIRVLVASSNDQIAIPCKQIFDEIFEDRFLSLKTGFLKYR